MLFDSYFTFESKLGWHRLFLGIDEGNSESCSADCWNKWSHGDGKFNEQFQILPLELKVEFI